MTNCEELQIFENGVCIAERLGKCRVLQAKCLICNSDFVKQEEA